MTRRAFLKGNVLLLAALGIPLGELSAEEQGAGFEIGLLTDLHYADKPAAGSRHYRDTMAKLQEAKEAFSKNNIAAVLELGDLIDAADSTEAEKGYLAEINRVFSSICKDRHYVLGNHCVSTLTKDEFLKGIEREKSFYSFDRGGFHLVVLDACFRSDGEPYGKNNFKWTDSNIPDHQLDWLANDLASTQSPTIVFAHQRLDVANDHGVKNAKVVRAILESSKKVSTVFQGHSHQNDYKEIGGLHYVTLVAMVEGKGPENSGYSILTLHADGSLKLEGFRNQHHYPRHQG